MSKPKLRIEKEESRAAVDNGLMRIESDLTGGTMEFRWPDGRMIRGLYGEVRLGSELLRTSYYSTHRLMEASIGQVEDGFGRGLSWCVEHLDPGKPVLRQRFWCYEGVPYGFVQLEAEQRSEWETNEMAPMAALLNDGSVFHFGPSGQEEDIRVQFTPFDNDKWVRYGSFPIPCSVESCEVTAVYQAESRNGFVIGSVTHDTWKTGVKVEGTFAKEVTRLRVYAGAANLQTRDTVPHGSLRGRLNVSPRIMVGAFGDYREGLEAYGRANAVLMPALPWSGGVPFGWNSWSAVMGKLDLEVYVHTSDFIKKELQDQGFSNDGVVYVNFDAFWNKLTGDELAEAVRRVRSNGQKPGIYYTPFAFWGDDPDSPVEELKGSFTYRELLLKDEAGRILPKLDGAYAIDPSHPAALERIIRQLDRFVEWGFEYVKLDFLTHGAMEGRHFLREVRTGIQAYNMGMAVIRDTLAPERIGKPFFINLSIAPLFPHGYAHSRRISCDAFGVLEDTEYMLNALTYGWWINDALYRFNDPDHTVLYKSENQRETSEEEGLSRLNASVIAGTSLLLGDDYRMEEAARRARLWMTQPEVMALAKTGRTFRPLEGRSGDRAEDVFTKNTMDGEVWVAVFNFDGSYEAVKSVPLKRMGVPSEGALKVTDVSTGSTVMLDAGLEALEVRLRPAESRLLRMKLSH